MISLTSLNINYTIPFLLTLAGVMHFFVIKERLEVRPIVAYLYGLAGIVQIILGIVAFVNVTPNLLWAILVINFIFLAFWIISQLFYRKLKFLSYETIGVTVLIRKLSEAIIFIIALVLLINKA